MTLAEELMGLQRICLLPASRVHIMPDTDEPADTRNLSDQILEWCRILPRVDMEMVVREFGVTPGQATTYLQRFHRRGFLVRSHKVKSAGQRPMQVWKYARPQEGR